MTSSRRRPARRARQPREKAKSGIMALRGRWREVALDAELGEGVASLPALPTFHPAYLLRRPQEKAKAWRDMLSLQARLESA